MHCYQNETGSERAIERERERKPGKEALTPLTTPLLGNREYKGGGAGGGLSRSKGEGGGVPY